jgi:hypothetical protein
MQGNFSISARYFKANAVGGLEVGGFCAAVDHRAGLASPRGIAYHLAGS